jgi:endonuclease YncB( thermonuclease family)
METSLLNANPDDFQLYSLEGLKTIGKFCTNYDGDTCHMLMMIDGKIQKHNVRMMGYDSPEMKPPVADPKRDEKKLAAVAAKTRLAELCKGKLLYVQCHGGDKYGRQLVTLYTDANYNSISINQRMIDEGHGLCILWW